MLLREYHLRDNISHSWLVSKAKVSEDTTPKLSGHKGVFSGLQDSVIQLHNKVELVYLVAFLSIALYRDDYR